MVEEDILFMHGLAATQFLALSITVAHTRILSIKMRIALILEEIITVFDATNFPSNNCSEFVSGVSTSNRSVSIHYLSPWRTKSQLIADRGVYEKELEYLYARIVDVRRSAALFQKKSVYYETVVHKRSQTYRNRHEKQRGAERHLILTHAENDGNELRHNFSKVNCYLILQNYQTIQS